MRTECFLVQRANSEVLSAIRLSAGHFVVGRSSQAEILVPHASVSRRHALLAVSAARVLVKDLHSHNGTYIDDARVQLSPLTFGQRIRFGAVSFALSRSPSDNCDSDSQQDTCDRRELGGAQTKTADAATELTPAQKRVSELLLTGCLEKQVVAKLGLSPHTVHNHARKIYRVYGVHSRAELLLCVLPSIRQMRRNEEGGR